MEKQHVDVHLGYVDTKSNPADCATRGPTSLELVNHIWWKGHTLQEIRNGDFVSTLFEIPKEDGEDEPTDCTTMLVKSSPYEEMQFQNLMETSRYNSNFKRDMDLPPQSRDDAEAEKDDESYPVPKEKARLQNQVEASKALQTSQALTEKYWSIWKQSYLTALKENHRRHLNQKQRCAKVPRIGEIVLLSEPCQKRFKWEMARILKLIPSSVERYVKWK
ncbi:hypothetical protein GCK32_009371 [Trichostrongylus colubriformis]|uniref:DUF5641 domain-containing protein n=1 Tax=Trichostrongylus colubriformis TaxID=6319 RepID=A0AAN8FR55_TRICO